MKKHSIRKNGLSTVVCVALMSAISMPSASANCERFYQDGINDLNAKIEGKIEGGIGATIMTLGLLSPMLIARINKTSHRKALIRSYKQAIQFLNEARAGEGPQLTSVYLEAAKKSKLDAQHRISFEEFSDMVRRADEKDVFCTGKLSSMKDIRKWAEQRIELAELR
jgi:hypothetical protein